MATTTTEGSMLMNVIKPLNAVFSRPSTDTVLALFAISCALDSCDDSGWGLWSYYAYLGEW